MTKRSSFIGWKEEWRGDRRHISQMRVASSRNEFQPTESAAPKSDKEIVPEASTKFRQGFHGVIQLFFERSLGFLEVTDNLVLAYGIIQSHEVEKLLEKYVEPSSLSGAERIENWNVVELPPDVAPRTGRRLKSMARRLSHLPMMESTFIMGLVSQYDSFIGQIIREVALVKPHIVFGSDKKFSASEVFRFESLEDFQEGVLQKEIEVVLRQNHEEQIKWLESALSIRFNEDGERFNQFLEIFERRNIYAHSDGRVSETYRKNLKKWGVECTQEVGEKIDLGRDYLRASAVLLLEFGVKLGNLAWRKAHKTDEEHAQADQQLSDFGFDLIYHGFPEVAARILESGFRDGVRHPNREVLLMMRINLANAYKLSGDMNKAEAELAKEDWRPIQPHFQLCAAAVREDIDEVRALIDQVPSSKIKPIDYVDWPVFSGILKNPSYSELLREKFGDETFSLLYQSSDF